MDDGSLIRQPPVRQLLLQESSEISSSASAADTLVVEMMMSAIAVVMHVEMIAFEKTDILAAVADHLVESENYSAVGIPHAVHCFGASEEQPELD